MKSKEKKMFPLFVDLTQKKVLVVGAGKNPFALCRGSGSRSP